MDYEYYYADERDTQREMQQKHMPRDSMFNFQNETQLQRPMSVATEFVDTDWDGDDTVSEPEGNSPRVSLRSLHSGQPSFTTVSSYDEVPTPRSSQFREVHMVEQWHKPTEGPRGPHLFRGSTDEGQLDPHVQEEEVILTLSPITTKPPQSLGDALIQSQPPRKASPFRYTRDDLDTCTLSSWTPEMVAQSMLNAGIEQAMSDRFIENDINGAILITLKFEDLRELDIPSFGIRTRVWHQIQSLKDSTPPSPRAETPIEDVPSREVNRDTKVIPNHSAGQQHTRRNVGRSLSADDIITPMESVSIIGIEQVIPKTHTCSKGENCSKWRKQQRLVEQLGRTNPHIDINAGGTIVAGDAGNPETARALNVNEQWRPFSDAVTSVVASSDVMGSGGVPALQYLHEATLRNVQSREAQDNVRQFLNFQQFGGNEVPPTPPFEVITSAAHDNAMQGSRHLPRLSIPVNRLPARPSPPRAATVPPPTAQLPQRQQPPPQQQRQPSPQEFTPYQMSKTDPRSSDLDTSQNLYRFGTPFSEVDVPVTNVTLGPVARDASQSVPPDMSYRISPTNQSISQGRSQSRASGRRPSFPVLPAVDENRPVRVASKTPSPQAHSPPTMARNAPHQPMQAPPRAAYPWSGASERVIAPPANFRSHEAPAATGLGNITYQGPMRKRKTRMLRHEWQDGYFTLKGTRLNMHKDEHKVDRTLEYVDIDDYAIACSSLASSSKLSAAFKAVSITHNREKSDQVGAFSFQLVPQDKERVGARLKKRESAVPASNGVDGVNGTGKTHHFAVKNRDERIDWMRELMLAKAMKQKGEGFEVSVNGNMI